MAGNPSLLWVGKRTADPIKRVYLLQIWEEGIVIEAGWRCVRAMLVRLFIA